MKKKKDERNRKGPTLPPQAREDNAPDRKRPDLYGLLPVLEALRSDRRRVERVLVAGSGRESRLAEIFDLCRSRGIAWDHVSRESISRIFPDGVNHQGVAAFVGRSEYVDADEIFPGDDEAPLILVLDGVEDPRNLGAILRVVECAGAHGVVLPERRAVGLNETVAKSSAGAIEYVRVAKTANINRYIESLKAKGIWVVGTGVGAATTYTDWDWTQPTALILGGEGRGLHRLVAENCDTLVNIPMHGKIDSLNVSVAAGVILFEARRQRAAVIA